MDKSRRQFEEYMRNRFPDADGFTNYVADLVWQASRESLINNLEPVGYIMESSFDNIKEYGYTHLNEEISEKIDIPLYRLD